MSSLSERQVEAGGRQALIDRLAALCGADGVLLGAEDRAFYAQDVYASGSTPLAVVRPGNLQELAGAVEAAVSAGVALFPRGGGMSYTSGFLPDRTEAIIVDLSRMNRVLDVNARDLHATVEAGCTWSALDDAIAPHGLRATFWGPTSGRTSTVGGAMSQGAATFGSGRAGASGASALSFEVVLPDGRILNTGTGGRESQPPFFRQYGPDLTGLFAHDCGAVGIKGTITVALEPRPPCLGALAFGFASFEAAVAAVEAISRHSLASEIIMMDAELLRMNLGSSGLREDLRTLLNIVRAAPSKAAGLRHAARIGLSGRRFAERAAFSAHIVVEGADRAQLAWTIKRIRSVAAGDGFELPNSVGTMLRLMPFPELPVTSADGRRLLAIHAIVPFSKAAALERAIGACIEGRKSQLERAGIAAMTVCSTLGRNAFLYEPFLYWKDSLELYHQRMTPTAMAAAMPRHPPNPEARRLVEALRCELIDIMAAHGAAHLQIGRAYPYLRDRSPAFLDVIRGLKRQLDPAGLMNPGALGLP